ncbi:MAG: hypothetical protein OEL83_07810 [Desulforhopalus sp.]|nr:hypothetical protein [Desulforhopalus sp.]
METKLELAAVKANAPPLGGLVLYWLFSRNQLEFVLQDIAVVHSPPLADMAQYQETMLPVINLERHFGLQEQGTSRSTKYLVIRAVTAEKTLVKVIVLAPNSLKIQELRTGYAGSRPLSLPRNTNDILGSYSLPEGGLGIVPDIASICSHLRLRGSQPL